MNSKGDSMHKLIIYGKPKQAKGLPDLDNDASITRLSRFVACDRYSIARSAIPAPAKARSQFRHLLRLWRWHLHPQNGQQKYYKRHKRRGFPIPGDSVDGKVLGDNCEFLTSSPTSSPTSAPTSLTICTYNSVATETTDRFGGVAYEFVFEKVKLAASPAQVSFACSTDGSEPTPSMKFTQDALNAILVGTTTLTLTASPVDSPPCTGDETIGTLSYQCSSV